MVIFSRRKTQEFFPMAPFFFVLYMIAYQSVLIPRKLLCSKKFLVTRLERLLLLISFVLINIYLYMEQKQLSSHTKIKKKCASVLHPVFLCILKIRQQERRKCLNIQITTVRVLNGFRPTSHIAREKRLYLFRWVAKTF